MTAQCGDILIIDGQELCLFSNPLETLWSEERPRPLFLPESTANWRWYVATWTIENRRLNLAGIRGDIEVDDRGNVVHGETDFMQNKTGRGRRGGRSALLDLLFPGTVGPVFAEWYSGVLRVPEGAPIVYVHFGYLSVFERELHIAIERGWVLESRWVPTGEELRREQEARQRRLDRVLEAQPGEDGWVRCPHCGGAFCIRHADRWDGERHRCGGRIHLGGPLGD
jgi:hypothetical protein